MSKNIKFFLIPFLLGLPLWLGMNFFQNNLEKFFYAQIFGPFEQIAEIKIPQKPLLELEAESALTIRISQAGKEKTLFRKNASEILPLASLTKLMTAVIVLEDPNYDLRRLIVISKTAAGQENAPNYGNLKIRERFSVEKLLELMLSYSSNDAAYGLAEFIGLDNFISKMNSKAQELGLSQTQFSNPTGLDPEKLFYDKTTKDYFNHSSADDLAVLARYILQNHPLIFEITLKKKIYSAQNGVSDLVLADNQTMLGGKTGYTDEAGGCLVFLFKNENGSIFLNALLGSPSPESRVKDAQKMISWVNGSINSP